MDKINFHLPGLFEHPELTSYICYTLKTYPEMFNDWVKIESFYGCKSNIKFSGGRYITINIDSNIYENVKNNLENNNINSTLILSNSLITEEMLNDKNTNELLMEYHKKGNSVVISSDILKEYIRNNYPNYKIISSVTKVLNKKEVVNELNKDYDLVCLLHDYNKDFNFLSSLPHPEKVELMINHTCVTDMDKCKKHYKFISSCLLEQNDKKMSAWKCPYKHGAFYNMMEKDYFIKANDIPMYKEKYGIENVKITGRHLFYPDLLECLTYYLIKPEYQIEFRTKFYIGIQ